MSIIDLAEAKILDGSTRIPLVYSLGEQCHEPYFELDDNGEPQNFDIDLEPPDPTLEEAQVIDDRLYHVAPSQFAEIAVRVPEAGRVLNFSFEGREYLRRIYDTSSKKVLLCCGRQVEKSTTLGNKLLCYSALTNNFRSLYVAPSAEQAKVFSNDRIKDVIDVSPLLRAYTSSMFNQAVFFKKFINYSQIRLRYAYLTADRTRGISADLVLIDELQDILIDNIPVIEQCAFHSEYKLFLYSGTPKSVDNTIEFYWSEFSTQNEWAVPCERHGTPNNPSSWHWNVLREKNIGLTGLICDRCGEPISARNPNATWVSMNPMTANNTDKVTFEGYRIPQIMVPWVNWAEILAAQEQYSRAQFMNEKLGISYDSGVRPINKAQLKQICRDDIRLVDIEEFRRIAQGRTIYVGLDWGCHDDQTRILTERGFIYFRDLIKEDKVAQWDPDSLEMTFTHPTAITAKKYDGSLLHFHSPRVDMLLTPDHRMRMKTARLNWSTEEAETTAQRGQVEFNGTVKWAGKERRSFELPGIPAGPGYSGSTPITFPMDDWLEFLGYYLAEGSPCNVKRKSDPEQGESNCIKISQITTKSSVKANRIKACMRRLKIPFSEFSNPSNKYEDWTICDRQFWKWFHDHVGSTHVTKRIPREFLTLSSRQLKILFNAMFFGGHKEKRNGHMKDYRSSSRGLCEDFQEICIKLGLCCTVRLLKKATDKCNDLWVAAWSRGRNFKISTERQVASIPYQGNVYCCTVPSGYIVTERNGRIAYQGNSGTSSSYTVISFGGYLGTGNFSIFWIHRFTGPDMDPERQLDLISQMCAQLQVRVIGVDYGGGFYQNDILIKRFGPQKVHKYQYNPRQKKKIYWEPNLRRWMCHRSEIMSDIFNAMKAKKIDLPNWADFEEPYGMDILNIFTEYNERLRMNEYKRPAGKTDDSFHSILYCTLASMIENPRPDIITPSKDTGIPIEY